MITFENWKRCVADNPSVVEFLYTHRRDKSISGLFLVFPDHTHLLFYINSWTPVRANHFTSDFRRVKMANRRDPRMAKAYDKKSIYYH